MAEQDETSGEFLALDASMTQHIEAYNQVVEHNLRLARHLITLTRSWHTVQHGDEEWSDCKGIMCRMTLELVEKLDV